MPLDPHAARLLHMLSVGEAADLARAGFGDRRRALAELMRFSDRDVAAGICEDRLLPGPDDTLAVRVYSPLQQSSLQESRLQESSLQNSGSLAAGLVYFHGGGFVAGSLDTHDALCRVLANKTGCRIISVAYRLAPEHKFPAAVEDAEAATRWILAHAADFGLDPNRVGVGGDSAGATLAIITCHRMREDGGSMPAFQLLLCPITDFAGSSRSRQEFAIGYLIDAAMIERDLAHYLPDGARRDDPRVSPLRAANLRGMPQAFIHTAEYDPFRDEGNAYAQALRDAGVAVASCVHPGMIHLFYAMPAVIPYARHAMARLGTEIKMALKPAT